MAGDICIYTRAFLRPLIQVRSNDFVAMQNTKTKKLYIAQIVKLEGENLTLGIKPKAGAPHEIHVKLSEIRGKFVWKLDPGEEVRKLMRQIHAKRSEAPIEKGT